MSARGNIIEHGRHPKDTRATLRKMQRSPGLMEHVPKGERRDVAPADWEEFHAMAEWTESDVPLKRELTACGRLALLGNALESGGTMPPEAARWLGRALVEIAKGKDADSVFGIWRKQGRPKKRGWTKIKAATMAYLVDHDMNQDEAAWAFATWLPRYRERGVSETRDLKQAHNDLKARRGIFSSVEAVEISPGEVRFVLPGSHWATYYMDHADSILAGKK
jgi:hypothetical protein